jgi:hypothetical protein
MLSREKISSEWRFIVAVPGELRYLKSSETEERIMLIKGFIVRATAGAVAFVGMDADSASAIRPLWVPTSKTISFVETDVKSKSFRIQEGENVATRVGIPCEMDICDKFAAKVGVAA